jgi:uncharacterized protein YndB with AHSA1/START domain
MKTLTKTYTIHASPERVWKALVDPTDIIEWSDAPAGMDDQVGTEFILWDGEIWGTNTEVVYAQRLAQDWFDNEKQTEPTKVVFSLTAKEGDTVLELIQSNIPDNRLADLSEGWDTYYLAPLKAFVEEEV